MVKMLHELQRNQSTNHPVHHVVRKHAYDGLAIYGLRLDLELCFYFLTGFQ
jgi:hypothetical protein